MKKSTFLLITFSILGLNLYAIGGFSSCRSSSFSSCRSSSFSSSRSYSSPSRSYSSSSRTSSYASKPISVTRTTTKSYTYVKPTTSKVATKAAVKTNTTIKNNYHSNTTPFRYYSGHMMLWYFVFHNPKTNRQDTIKAKTQAELDKKIKANGGNW